MAINLAQLMMNFDRRYALCIQKLYHRSHFTIGGCCSNFNRCNNATVRPRDVPVVHASCDIITLSHGCANDATEGKRFKSPIHCCDVTKPPYLFSGELCTSPLHCKLSFVCYRRRGQCFSLLRTRDTDVVRDSSGRSYVTKQWHNLPLLHTRALSRTRSRFTQ